MLPAEVTRRGFLRGATALVSGAALLNLSGQPESGLLWTPETAYLPKMEGCDAMELRLFRQGSKAVVLSFVCSPRGGIVWRGAPGDEIQLNDGGKLREI